MLPIEQVKKARKHFLFSILGAILGVAVIGFILGLMGISVETVKLVSPVFAIAMFWNGFYRLARAIEMPKYQIYIGMVASIIPVFTIVIIISLLFRTSKKLNSFSESEINLNRKSS